MSSPLELCDAQFEKWIYLLQNEQSANTLLRCSFTVEEVYIDLYFNKSQTSNMADDISDP